MDISGTNDYYRWGFSLVSNWGAHLDPNDGVLWDISPASIGNLELNNFPENWSDYREFYDMATLNKYPGHEVNPIIDEPYQKQEVPRGDYARVLAEFWADGPDSETPPGHWFVILNSINDNPQLIKKLMGDGELLTNLEWDVKSYFILGGAMHDAAISAWSIKGWYDYIRPISAIRHLSDLGQSTDSLLPNYHPLGVPLIEGKIELILEDDPLLDLSEENLHKIKLYTWKGHELITNPEVESAGVGWILAEDWMPYQRPSFVTPPFAGYISGHSTYSRAAAEVLTQLTGSPYFPGGLGEFLAKKKEYLVFEDGPSVDVRLQWATYRDASDQCSLSRIWGGIHPPADDIPGRLIGAKVGQDAFEFAVPYFNSDQTSSTLPELHVGYTISPNPSKYGQNLSIKPFPTQQYFEIIDVSGTVLMKGQFDTSPSNGLLLDSSLQSGLYFLKIATRIFKVVIH